MDNNSIAHTKWNCTYHIVFIPKYRKKVFYGQMRKDLVEIIRKLCEMKTVELIKGAACVDHVHLYLGIPPKLNISNVVAYIKRSSLYQREKCVNDIRPTSRDKSQMGRTASLGTRLLCRNRREYQRRSYQALHLRARRKRQVREVSKTNKRKSRHRRL